MAQGADMQTDGVPWTAATETFFIKLSGATFRCDECGSNCFTKTDERDGEIFYRCNGCSARYIGEPKTSQGQP